jgi:hypothetical protein
MSDLLNFNPVSLGCGAYRVFYRDRCATTSLLAEADVSDGSFNRTLNDISSASITVRLRADSEECCGVYSTLNPWQHELAIYRDNVEVWCGPITRMELDFMGGEGTVEARDLLAWADKRAIEVAETDYDVTDADLKDVFEWVLNHAYCKDPWCMSWSLEEVGVPISRYYPAFDSTNPDGSRNQRWGGTYPVAGDELRDLSSAGVDYTVICRHMWGGSVEVSTPVPLTSILYDDHWVQLPKIIVSGDDMATRVIAGAGNSGPNGWEPESMWIEPQEQFGPITPSILTPIQRQYGLLESVKKESKFNDVDTTVSPNALTQSVYGQYELSQAPFVYITGGRLSPSAPLSFNNLVPGARFDIRLNQSCRLIYNNYRLYNVDVSFSAEDEDISVEFGPVGVESTRSL